MTINESVEDYLEAILVLKEKNGMVRSIDVVHHMNYSKPSISRAMSRLRENGYITMDQEGWLGLTDAGREKKDLTTEGRCGILSISVSKS